MSKRIDIKITFQCNNYCRFCVQGDKRDIYPDKTAKEIYTILRDAKKEYDEVVFTGGEPTIRPDLFDLVSYACRLKYRIFIQTNGRMFAYKDFCSRMILAGAHYFTIAVHGHNTKTHDQLIGVKGGFEQVLKAIKNLKSFGCVVFTNTVITKSNFRYLPDIAKMLISLGVREYRFSYPHILGSARQNLEDIAPLKKDIMPYVKKGLIIGKKHKVKGTTEAIPACLLGSLQDCMQEIYVPEAKVFDVYTIDNFDTWRKETGKIKGEKCSLCKHFLSCEGPWREYPEIFGWKEFNPII
ncbi:MAG: radical SAM protein [Candidatus Omnitrophota bacterium]